MSISNQKINCQTAVMQAGSQLPVPLQPKLDSLELNKGIWWRSCARVIIIIRSICDLLWAAFLLLQWDATYPKKDGRGEEKNKKIAASMSSK